MFGEENANVALTTFFSHNTQVVVPVHGEAARTASFVGLLNLATAGSRKSMFLPWNWQKKKIIEKVFSRRSLVQDSLEI